MNRRFFHGFLLVVGALLFITAFMKLHGLYFDPFTDIKSGFPKSVIFFAASLEAILAYFCFAKHASPTLWLALVAFFGVLLCVAGYQWISGARSCGCSGAYSPSPFVALTVDVLLLGMLGLVKPNFGQNGILKVLKESWHTIVSQDDQLGKIAGVSLVGAGTLLWYFGSVFFSPIAVANQSIHLGNVEHRSSHQIKFSLTNVSNQPIRVIGASSSCNCVSKSTDEIVLVLPKSTIEFSVTYTVNNFGFNHQRMVYFIDAPHQREVAVDLFAFVSKE